MQLVATRGKELGRGFTAEIMILNFSDGEGAPGWKSDITIVRPVYVACTATWKIGYQLSIFYKIQGNH
jgi:hypothetical protein